MNLWETGMDITEAETGQRVIFKLPTDGTIYRGKIVAIDVSNDLVDVEWDDGLQTYDGRTDVPIHPNRLDIDESD